MSSSSKAKDSDRQSKAMARCKAEKLGLPEDIIIDILTRLPAKSIGQFRCVSKEWLSFLSNPQFIKAHLTLHAHQQQEQLILVSESRSLHTITFTPDPENGIDGISRKVLFEQFSDNFSSIVGSCNGLVLVTNNERIHFLINPLTLQYHEIPKFDVVLPVPTPVGVRGVRLYGLGYDVVSDDYKVVTLSYYFAIEPDRRSTLVHVYSVRKGIWRRLENCPYDPEQHGGVLVNGALHWVATKRTSGYPSVIVAFDLSDEKFLELPAPPIGKRDIKHNRLVSLSGFLCMFINLRPMYIDENKIDVCWIMKDYGVAGSWTKFIVKGNDPGSYFQPICLMGEDDIVLNLAGSLILYNKRADQWRSMMVGFPTKVPFYRTRTFKESLVSPTLR